jgi:hypothetical protein
LSDPCETEGATGPPSQHSYRLVAGRMVWRDLKAECAARSETYGLTMVRHEVNKRLFSVVITLTVRGSPEGLASFAQFVQARVRASRRIAGGDAGVPGGWMRG